MAHDVFISYSSKDKAVADSAVAALEKNKFRCWYAPRDIKPGADWGDEIAKSINASSVFLLIFSSSANQSRRVLDELNLAIAKEVVILPFRIEKLDPSGAMQLHLSSRHWLDAFIPSWEKHLDKLVKSVSSILKTDDGADALEYAASFAQPSAAKKGKRGIIGIVAAVTLFAFALIFGIPKLLDQAGNSPESMALTELPPSATITPTEINAPTPTAISSPTPDGMALGSAENPIVWMYVPNKALDFNDVSVAADEIMSEFEKSNPGLSLSILPAPNSSTIIEALCDEEAHIGSLMSIPFMVASSRDCAEAKLITSVKSDIQYGGMIVTNTDSNFSDITQLEGKTLCINSYTSTSGWTLPSLEIRSIVGDPDSFFSQIIEMGDASSVIDAVYHGQCDAGTAYYDIREYVDIPDVKERVQIISTTTTVPYHNISFGMNIDPALTQKLVDYFLEASPEADNFALLSGLDNSETFKLIEINDYFYDEIWDLIHRAGATPEEFLDPGS